MATEPNDDIAQEFHGYDDALSALLMQWQDTTTPGLQQAIEANYSYAVSQGDETGRLSASLAMAKLYTDASNAAAGGQSNSGLSPDSLATGQARGAVEGSQNPQTNPPAGAPPPSAGWLEKIKYYANPFNSSNAVYTGVTGQAPGTAGSEIGVGANTILDSFGLPSTNRPGGAFGAGVKNAAGAAGGAVGAAAGIGLGTILLGAGILYLVLQKKKGA